MRQLTKVQLIITILLSVVTPLLTAVGSYQKAMGDMNTQMESMRTERERDFVRKDDFKPLIPKIDAMASDIAEIKGYLKRR